MTNYEILKEYEEHQKPVPSYDEWQASEKYNKNLEEVIKVYERKDKQATETSIAYNELLEENAQLKELLKECKQCFDWYHIDTTTGKEYIESWHKKGYEIHKKIDEALQ